MKRYLNNLNYLKRTEIARHFFINFENNAVLKFTGRKPSSTISRLLPVLIIWNNESEAGDAMTNVFKQPATMISAQPLVEIDIAELKCYLHSVSTNVNENKFN